MKTWNATDAKRHFAKVVDGSAEAPQVVLLRGRPVSVVVSYEHFLKSEEQTTERTVAQWLDNLEPLRHQEPDMKVTDEPKRTDRPDQFGDNWK